MADPFSFLVENLHKKVHVHVVNGDVITGVLLSVDEHCNVLLERFTSQAVTKGEAREGGVITVGMATGSADGRKKVKQESSLTMYKDADTIRFIRGSVIKYIKLAI
ncbi:LSM domain containing protein, putative [Angomonas deanei]|uniref:LSM domain containing protein, putative n=1 Tax=Angomonas deanei TaxID=59799 RepID=A0A7G2CU59_9TRYP|nr:LSM domain containing protein, putative [Angomonas deanei]